MTKEQIEKYTAASLAGTIPDEENPIFLFSTTSTKLLVKALNKEFSLTALVRLELAGRGRDLKGEWVGFAQAADILKKYQRPQQKTTRTSKGKHL